MKSKRAVISLVTINIPKLYGNACVYINSNIIQLLSIITQNVCSML